MFGRNKRTNERPGDFGGTNFDLIGEGDPDGFYLSDAATKVRHLSELALGDVTKSSGSSQEAVIEQEG